MNMARSPSLGQLRCITIGRRRSYAVLLARAKRLIRAWLADFVHAQQVSPVGKSPAASEDLPRGCQCYGLLMFDLHWLKQLEIERRFRSKRDVAIAREPRTTGTRRGADQSPDRRALPAAGQRSDNRSAGRSAADHGCGALALSLPGHRRSRGLNFIVLTVDSDARQCQRKH